MAFKDCAHGFTRTRKECTDLRDDGYEKCDEWGKECVEWVKGKCIVQWIPIIGPVICKVFELVCAVFKPVCVFAVWVSHWVCHAFNIVTTVMCIVFEAANAVLFIAGIFIKAIFSIPIVGALIKEIINTITSIVFGAIGFVIEGIACGLIGLCLPKKLRLCVIITRRGNEPVATVAQVQPIVDRMIQIYRDDLNIDVYAEIQSDGNVPEVTTADCEWAGWWEDLWLHGTQYESSASLHCRGYSMASVAGLGSPIYAFAVRDVAGADKNGCSLGPITNYVLFEVPEPGCPNHTHLAHEAGHACNLWWHHPNPNNLMYFSCDGDRHRLEPVQKVLVRGSKYVTYF